MGKKVEILSVGTELLMGQIANTNAQYISQRLPEVGLGVFYPSWETIRNGLQNACITRFQEATL